jgi:hypothetical protein
VKFRDFLDRIDAALPKEQESISSWITKPPTRRRSCAIGWPSGLATTSTSPQPKFVDQSDGALVLSQKQIERANHHSVKQLQEAIEAFVKDHNASPKPFRWVKSADQILASIIRFVRSVVLQEINDSGD